MIHEFDSTDLNHVYTREEIEEAVEALGEECILFDGLDEAFVGFSRRPNAPLLAVYSYERIVAIRAFRDGMTYEEAVEFTDYNTCGAWVGDGTPLILYPIEG